MSPTATFCGSTMDRRSCALRCTRCTPNVTAWHTDVSTLGENRSGDIVDSRRGAEELMQRVLILLIVGACSGTDVSSCAVTCATDGDCPSGQTCGALGRCTSNATHEACTSNVGEFLS